SAHVQELIETYLLPLPEKVQLAIALVQGDTLSFVGAERKPEGIRYCDNRSAVFEIGSITKVFTATLLAYEVEQGALRLDAPIQELVPFKLKQAQRGGVDVTLKHIANHTSGIRHQPPNLALYAFLHGHPRQPFRDYTQERFERHLRRGMKLAFTPGERYRYSNMGMSLVGTILSLRNNKSYEELLQTKLFQPLGMNLSTTLVSNVQYHVVSGLEKAGVRSPNWDMYALSPAGGIKTCAEDFAKFVCRQFSSSPAIATTQEPTFKIEENYFVGLGWHIIDRTNGERWLNHGGGMLGYTANVNINVCKKCATIVLTNLGNALNWQRKSFELSRDLLSNLEKCFDRPL
ncbi:MAG: serine hydrolase domain-containing protein, partial [Anaerolineales bacterium]